MLPVKASAGTPAKALFDISIPRSAFIVLLPMGPMMHAHN
jgi:hypothetical protein